MDVTEKTQGLKVFQVIQSLEEKIKILFFK